MSWRFGGSDPSRPKLLSSGCNRTGVPMQRRAFLTAAAGAASALIPGGARAFAGPPGLRPMTAGTTPISAGERRARVNKLQRLMVEQGVGALIVESGPSLDY